MLRSKMGVHPKVASCCAHNLHPPSHGEEAAEKIWHFPPRGSSATFLRILRTPALWVGSSSARWGNFATKRARPRPRHFVWAILIWLDGHPYQAHWDLNISVLHMFRMFYPWERTLPKTIATHSESVVTNASPFTSCRSLFLCVLS